MINVSARPFRVLLPAGVGALALTFMLGGALVISGCGEKTETNNADSLATGAEKPDDHEHKPGEEGSGHTHTTRLEFSAQPTEIPVGAPATLNLRIVDIKTGAPVKDFAMVHEKLLHLIIVSSDLTWFNHIHPEYKGDGLFTITTSFPSAGSYKLFADYTPKDGEHEVAEHVFSTTGAPSTPAAFSQPADTGMVKGFVVKQMKSAPEGEPAAVGSDIYEIGLMPMPRKMVAGEDVMLHFEIRDGSGKPMTDVEPYLGAMGHAVILSSDGSIYLHTHPMDGDMDHSQHGSDAGTSSKDSAARPGEAKSEPLKPGGPDVMFHTNFPKPGLYKVWGQFQHKGRIITAPFVLNVEAGPDTVI